MTTAVPSTAIVVPEPVFSDSERLALAGFLAGYGGLTRDVYALDLRQFAAWCRRSGPLSPCGQSDERISVEMRGQGRFGSWSFSRPDELFCPYNSGCVDHGKQRRRQRHPPPHSLAQWCRR